MGCTSACSKESPSKKKANAANNYEIPIKTVEKVNAAPANTSQEKKEEVQEANEELEVLNKRGISYNNIEEKAPNLQNNASKLSNTEAQREIPTGEIPEMKEVNDDFKLQTRNKWKLKGSIVTKTNEFVPQARHEPSDSALECANEEALEQNKAEDSDDEYVM
eukprot:TRINITY_DN1897_c0_g1_i1.p1 TRINITY_DN1897_c0_g1~~TRINITY_DN1897_c0_g1_i1.p1  ORF type:complete len:163 (-),score=37.84 TRINITY_DN1897_c0_g1_i1:82-570(-)